MVVPVLLLQHTPGTTTPPPVSRAVRHPHPPTHAVVARASLSRRSRFACYGPDILALLSDCSQQPLTAAPERNAEVDIDTRGTHQLSGVGGEPG